MPKKRVAILGGGCGSMTAAYYLSNTPELRNALDVTVYQIGWRLGGKGASGRNQAIGDRIEEHGLHVWGGFYYNAFRMMQQVYTALCRPANCPLRTWQDAFTKHNVIVWEEWIGGQWDPWILRPHIDDGIPGQETPHPSVLQCIERVIAWIADIITNWPHAQVRYLASQSILPQRHLEMLRQSTDVLNAAGAAFDGTPLSTLRAAQSMARSMSAPTESELIQESSVLAGLLSTFRAWLRDVHQGLLAADNVLRRLFIVVDLGLTIGIGVAADGLRSGFYKIDGEDFRKWLARHGALPMALDSAALRGYYDYFFAYQDGDPDKPAMSAAMGLHTILRLVGDYKGSLFWKMQSGMGDAVFAPLYELCKRNGVQFRFFHRVDKLIPSDKGDSIAKVQIKRQVRTKGDYQPLICPKNVPSWPSEPLYNQIDPQDVAALKKRKADLEDPWTDWDDVETIELQAGRDFDAIVLGLSIGAFRDVCAPILSRDSVWADMVKMLPTIQTQAMQLWFTAAVDQLGFCDGNATGTAYANPHQSWSDMTPVIDVENWPADVPKAVIYFCGPMLTQSMPQGKNPAFGSGQKQNANRNAIQWTIDNLGRLYPAFGSGRSCAWDLLFDVNSGKGDQRFDAQYVRANYTPTERYVLDLPGTSCYRLDADTSGYSNLALAGDWIFTGLGGAVESAVIAGMLAARGLVRTISDAIVDETVNPWRRATTLVPVV